MNIWMECIIGTLAAVGLVCILKAVYDIIFTGYLRTAGACELFLYGNGTDPKTEQQLNTAMQVRRLYFPGLAVVFVENGEGGKEDAFNFAKVLCARRNMEYIE